MGYRSMDHRVGHGMMGYELLDQLQGTMIAQLNMSTPEHLPTLLSVKPLSSYLIRECCFGTAADRRGKGVIGSQA